MSCLVRTEGIWACLWEGLKASKYEWENWTKVGNWGMPASNEGKIGTNKGKGDCEKEGLTNQA